MGRDEALDAVYEAREDVLNAVAAEMNAITDARMMGATWQEIASIYGISRQAAQKRFGREVATTTDDIIEETLGEILGDDL